MLSEILLLCGRGWLHWQGFTGNINLVFCLAGWELAALNGLQGKGWHCGGCDLNPRLTCHTFVTCAHFKLLLKHEIPHTRTLGTELS